MNVNNEFLNKYFEKTTTSPTKWIDLYHKINKRNEKQPVGIEKREETKEQLDVNQNQVRRSKRRKTEAEENNKVKDAILKSNENKKKSEELLWTEKYQFTDEFDIVYNKSQLERLNQWLQQFKKKKKESKKNVNKASNSNSEDEDTYTSNTDSQSQFDDNDSDFNYDSDCSASTTSSSCSSATSKKYKFHNNAILLNGPFGSGKTSSVYCVAKQLDFKLFECNTSSLRSKSQILQELIGVLSSHHVGLNKKLSLKLLNEQEKSKNPDLFVQKNNKKQLKKNNKKSLIISGNNKCLDTFFKQKQVLVNSTNDNSPSRKRRKSDQIKIQTDKVPERQECTDDASEVKVLKDSLILFDDIDIVLKEDQGFWSVISFFIKNSKKPIILTCNDENMLKKIDLNIEEIKFSKPNRELCLNYLKTILLCESKRCLNEEFCLNQLITQNKCDLRHSLLQLQLNTSISKTDKGSDNHETEIKEKNPEHLNSNITQFVDYYMLIDYLNKNLNKLELINNKNTTIVNYDPLKYDCFVCREGLIDDTSLNSVPDLASQESSTIDYFNQQYFIKELIDLLLNNEKCHRNLYCYSHLNWTHEPVCNKVLYKLAFAHFKFTSNKSLYMEYAPCLKQICKVEQMKQESNVKRRFLHYLNTTSNIGLTKDDYLILAKDTKFDTIKQTTTVLDEKNSSSTQFKNDDIYESSS